MTDTEVREKGGTETPRHSDRGTEPAACVALGGGGGRWCKGRLLGAPTRQS